MLTHGWRDYINQPHVTYKNARHLPERYALHSGRVVNMQGERKKAKLLLFDNNKNKVLVFETNAKGEFLFEMPNTSQAVLMAYTTDDKQKLRIIKDKVKTTTISNQFYKNNLRNGKNIRPFVKPIGKIIKEKAEVDLITLSESQESLDEVVVVGYAATEKDVLLGSIATVKSEQIDAINSLQGRLSGVQISNYEEQGGNFNINIRGLSTVSGQEPLYVVDGVIADIETLSSIPTSQIKSI